MIAPLRRRHLLMTTTLLVAVPLVLAVALSSRPTRPRVTSLPADLGDGPGHDGNDVEAYEEVFAELAIQVWASRSQAGAVVELVPFEPLARPDVLLYWSPVAVSDTLGDSVVLLGAYSDRARSYALPTRCAIRDGYLVLYSLAHQEVVASGALPALMTPPPAPPDAEEDAP